MALKNDSILTVNLHAPVAAIPSHIQCVSLYKYLEHCADYPHTIDLSSTLHKANMRLLQTMFKLVFPLEENNRQACAAADEALRSEMGLYKSGNNRSVALTTMGLTVDATLQEVKRGTVSSLSISKLHLLASMLGWYEIPCKHIDSGKVKSCAECVSHAAQV